MAQILPPKFNIGTQIGSALGQGLSSGIQSGLGEMLNRARQNYQAQKLQETFQGLEGLTDPVQIAQALVKGSIYSPQADRTLSSLAPLLFGKLRTEQLYGKEGAEAPAPPPQATPAQAREEAKKFMEGQDPGGFLDPQMTVPQVEQYAENYARVLNTPEAYDKGFAQALNINQARIQQRQGFEDAARAMGITEQEMPRYLQVATRYQNLKDPAAINRETFKKFQEIKNQKESLKNLTVPGIGTKLFNEGGLIGALTSKGKTRQEYLKRYDDLVSKLVNEGEEPYVREQLSDIGLSPTEIEERIHPYTPQLKKKVDSLPPGNKMNAHTRQENLVKFFKENVDKNTSLSVLRHYLWNDKKYDWKEIANAIQLAFPDGQNLTQYQGAELAEIAKPPRQSLSELFGPGGDIRGFFRGQR